MRAEKATEARPKLLWIDTGGTHMANFINKPEGSVETRLLRRGL